MSCDRCGAEWGVTDERPTKPVHCPYCKVHICGCGCGADLSAQRSDSIYASESHKRSLQLAASPDKAPLKSVGEARAAQEDAKPHWSMVVREGIIDVLRTTGGYHADDLEHLGIPAEHRNIIGAQTRVLLEQGWMVEAGRRRSEIPSRHGAKSGIYRITKLGVLKIAGVGGGNAAESSPFGPAASASSSHSGEDPSGTAAVAPPAPEGSEPESGQLFDFSEAVERSRSAQTDPEAA